MTETTSLSDIVVTPSGTDAASFLPNGTFPWSGMSTAEEEQLHRKQRLAAAFRLFAKYGYDEGVAGHITARDPERLDHFWVNPFGMSFAKVRVSDLLLVNHEGEVVEGDRPVNRAAFAIHSQVHRARPDVVAAAHSHSLHGKAWSSLGRPLDPITQDACDFYRDHAVYQGFNGVVVDTEEGGNIATALGSTKAVILRNHGLLTVGQSVDEAAWWFVRMERCCQVQLMAEAAGTPLHIDDAAAKQTYAIQGTALAGWFTFQPLYQLIIEEQHNLLD
jgi:ribulose-5-phosphate 4-epimerase/fuculose-1-phosphate aldolase